MKHSIVKALLLILITFSFYYPTFAQTTDSTSAGSLKDSISSTPQTQHTTVVKKKTYIINGADTTIVNDTTPLKKKKKFYQTRVFKAVVVPSVLIGYGVSVRKDHGLISSYDVYDFINNDLNFNGTNVDDYLQYAPYAELVALNLLKIKCKNDILNTTLLIVKSELIMLAIVYPLKYWTGVVRPDSVEPGRNHSFPSGHTANAFVAASIVHKEFKHRSPWYGIGAYAIAGSVGIFRMLNNRHWQSDVFVGAGIGMLSVHLAYLTHRNKFGRKCDMFALPTYNRGNLGVCLVKKF